MRTVYSALDINKENDVYSNQNYSGNGFLYNMVRIIVGTLNERWDSECIPPEHVKGDN
ncbi:MAG: hypothetical protein ACLUR5_01230 [Eubacterium ventriosum]